MDQFHFPMEALVMSKTCFQHDADGAREAPHAADHGLPAPIAVQPVARAYGRLSPEGSERPAGDCLTWPSPAMRSIVRPSYQADPLTNFSD